MFRRVRRLPALVAILAMTPFLVMSSTQAQSELERVRATVGALQDEIDGYLAQLVETQGRADAAAVRYWEADGALYDLEVEIARLSERVTEIDAGVAALRGRMVEIAVQRYIDSAAPPSILAGDDINRAAVTDALARFVSEGSLDIIDEYRAAREDLQLAQAQLADRRRHQEELLALAAGAAAEVQAELAAIGDVYLAIAPKLYEQDRLLDSLEEAERRRLAEELRRRQAEEARRLEAARAAAAAEAAAAARAAGQSAADGAPDGSGSAGSGDGTLPPVRPGEPTEGSESTAATDPPALRRAANGWVCPLAGPFSHYDDFGAPRHYGGWHKGNDLIAAAGTPVLAVESGRVEHRANRIGGNSAYLYADSGNYYYNTHLSAYENVGTGWVPAGAVIGYVGDSGNAAGLPHLHFEYHRGGRGNHINPYPYVRDACF